MDLPHLKPDFIAAAFRYALYLAAAGSMIILPAPAAHGEPVRSRASQNYTLDIQQLSTEDKIVILSVEMEAWKTNFAQGACEIGGNRIATQADKQDCVREYTNRVRNLDLKINELKRRPRVR